MGVTPHSYTQRRHAARPAKEGRRASRRERERRSRSRSGLALICIAKASRSMVASPAQAVLFGGTLGFFTQLYANGVRQLPVLRKPWEHGIAALIGSGFGLSMIHMEERLRVYIEEQTAARGRK